MRWRLLALGLMSLGALVTGTPALASSDGAALPDVHVQQAADAAEPAPGGLSAPHESRPIGRRGTDKESDGTGAGGSGREPMADSRHRKLWSIIDPRSSDGGRVVAALLIVLALLVLTRFGLGRLAGSLGAGRRPSGVLEVLGRFPVARGQQLVLLKMARRIVLLHQSGSSMRTLSEVTDPDEVADLLARVEAGSSGREAARFRSILQQFQGQHEDASSPGSRVAAGPGAAAEAEIVDLTRHDGGFSRFLSWSRGGRGT